MSWPFRYCYPQNQQFLNTIPSFSNLLYFNDCNQNPFLQPLQNPFLNIRNQCSIYQPNCFHSRSNDAQDSHSLQKSNNKSLNPNFSFPVQEEKHQVYDEKIGPDIKLQSKQNPLKIQDSQFQKPKVRIKQKNLVSHNSSLRNDTKNIPKNYGKAMLSYIQKNSRQVKQILVRHKVDYLQFMIFVRSFKSKINTMHDLRQMWGQNQKQNKFTKCIRILSYNFMRKKCLPYIFNSRIKNYHTHIKYRKKIMEGIQNPQNFTKIKEF